MFSFMNETVSGRLVKYHFDPCQCFIIFVPMVCYFALLYSVLLALFMCKIK